jgi:hypothetical protein
VRSPYWTVLSDSVPSMKHQILAKYAMGLSNLECRGDFDLRRNVSLRLLLLRLQGAFVREWVGVLLLLCVLIMNESAACRTWFL